jgi:dihydroxy-acid dehydratase
MDTKRGGFEEPRFLNFPHLPDGATRDGQPVLNKYSTTITKDHDFPGAQVCSDLTIKFDLID